MLTLTNATVIADELALLFQDGCELFIPLETLRKACPCAHCQGEPDAIGRVVKPFSVLTEKSFTLTKITPVGGYALQLTWADGHASGIYSLEYLKRLGASLEGN